MERESQSTAPRPPKTRITLSDWVFLRKVETLIFAFMFLALPFFALKVLYTTTSTLSVKNTVVDLVRDLINWQQTARVKHVAIKLESKPPSKNQPSMYSISQDGRTLEEVRLPAGVSIIGSVTFTSNGMPESPSSFLVTKGIRSSHVEIDNQGIVSAPDP
jgi:cell division protein FtsL